MARGSKCPECNKLTGQYEKGAYHCSNEDCGTVWWTAFDQPSAGRKRKGYKCITCGNQKVHPIAKFDGIKIWRCSTCATTLVVPE